MFKPLLNELLTELLTKHKGKTLGILIGLIYGLLVVTFGFIKATFVGLSILAGYFIGKRLDNNESFKELLQKIFREH